MPKPVKSDPPAGRFSLGPGHLIFLGVFLLRLSVLLRLTHSPLLLPTRGDMHFYNDWAQEIVRGQFTQSLAFYGLPGYAYLLAVLYKVFGENPFVPGLLQTGLDAVKFRCRQQILSAGGQHQRNIPLHCREALGSRRHCFE